MSGANLTLDQVLDMSTAEALCGKLRETLAADIMPLVDAGKVETISTAAVQLIVATYLTAEKMGGNLLLCNCSEAVSSAFATLGLADLLKKMTG